MIIGFQYDILELWKFDEKIGKFEKFEKMVLRKEGIDILSTVLFVEKHNVFITVFENGEIFVSEIPAETKEGQNSQNIIKKLNFPNSKAKLIKYDSHRDRLIVPPKAWKGSLFIVDLHFEKKLNN